jgi:hypothetical protein
MYAQLGGVSLFDHPILIVFDVLPKGSIFNQRYFINDIFSVANSNFEFSAP